MEDLALSSRGAPPPLSEIGSHESPFLAELKSGDVVPFGISIQGPLSDVQVTARLSRRQDVVFHDLRHATFGDDRGSQGSKAYRSKAWKKVKQLLMPPLVHVQAAGFGQALSGFHRFLKIIAEILSHLASHFLHESRHALRVVLVQIAEVTGVRHGFQPSLFRFRSGESGQQPDEVGALTMTARRRLGIVDAEDQKAIPLPA
jgi:hypothetical protein